MRFLFVIIGIGAFGAFTLSIFRARPPAIEEIERNLDAVSSREYSAQAVLRDVTGDFSTGIATQKLFGDDFIVTISAQMNPPPKGSFYFGWLVKRDPEVEVMPLGKLALESDPSNLWKVAFRAAMPLRDYAEVWVTREQKEDDTPEMIVLKGKWQ